MHCIGAKTAMKSKRNQLIIKTTVDCLMGSLFIYLNIRQLDKTSSLLIFHRKYILLWFPFLFLLVNRRDIYILY